MAVELPRATLLYRSLGSFHQTFADAFLCVTRSCLGCVCPCCCLAPMLHPRVPVVAAFDSLTIVTLHFRFSFTDMNGSTCPLPNVSASHVVPPRSYLLSPCLLRVLEAELLCSVRLRSSSCFSGISFPDMNGNSLPLPVFVSVLSSFHLPAAMVTFFLVVVLSSRLIPVVMPHSASTSASMSLVSCTN